MMRKKYDAKKADVFALGVVLFVFIKGSPPFEVAKADDVYYKTLMSKPKSYWNSMDSDNKVSPELRSLIYGMLHYYPKERFSI